MISDDINQKLMHKDVIFINDLILQVTLGTTEWERQVARSVTISTAITTTTFSASIAIGLKKVNVDKQTSLPNVQNINYINYKDLIQLISDFCTNKAFFTLEEMIVNLENLIINQYTTKNILHIQMEIKLSFPSKNVKEIGVKIARSY